MAVARKFSGPTVLDRMSVEGAQAVDYDQYRRELWSNKALAYQHSFAGLCAHPVPRLLEATGVGQRDTVLDVGCGTGTLSALAIGRGARVTAVDAEPSMVELTRTRVPGAATCLAALPDLPFPDGSFDVVLANFVINHVGRPARAVTELHRVTAPGGRVGITLWPNPKPALQRLWDDVIRSAGIVPPVVPGPVPEDDFPQTLEGSAGLLQDCGFVDVSSRLVEWRHQVDPEEWWSGAANGVAGIGFVVARQDEAAVRRMRAQYDLITGRHLDPDGLLSLPTAAVLTTASRPRSTARRS